MPSSAVFMPLFCCLMVALNFVVNSVYCNSPVVSTMGSGSNPSDYPLGYGYPYGYGNQPIVASQLPYTQMSSSSYLPQYGSSQYYHGYYPSSYAQYQQQHQFRQTLPQNSAYYGTGSSSPYNSRPYGNNGPYSSGYGSGGYGNYGGIRSDCVNQYGQLGGGMSNSGQFVAGRPMSPFVPNSQSVYPSPQGGQSTAGGTFADHSYYKYNPYVGYYHGNYANGNGPMAIP